LAHQRQAPMFCYDRGEDEYLAEAIMQAVVDGKVVAQSKDIVDCKGYQYFPRAGVRMELLEKTAKTAEDLKCPHGVQFYDVVVGGKRHARGRQSRRAG